MFKNVLVQKVLKEFYGLYDDLKIVGKKLTPDSYPVKQKI